ncbi:phage holin family protein [Pseudomonas sp. zfem005]|uniref:phage holin family protein n=1 Tax=Pseudomonas sp. zfem005 TaxID=3078200 RepID=UPI000396991A|nr:phage holin family protein [Pseudomonas sp. zfem005]EQM67124.1 hypothetical protein L682_23245 [Pseudomonas alcaligenes OT 69]MDU9416125.1 phage holin family protein [Pseudomonas sp. zfem005]
MADLWTLLAALSCAAIFIRIITWRHAGERYRLGIGFCAYALAVCTGCFPLTVLLEFLAGKPIEPVSPWLSLVLVWLAVLVILARGNVARIVQLNWASHWDGVDRRRTGQ